MIVLLTIPHNNHMQAKLFGNIISITLVYICISFFFLWKYIGTVMMLYVLSNIQFDFFYG